MTMAIPPQWAPHPHPDNFVLATDLDGTLLAGSVAARRSVRELFAKLHPNVRLVFVTGRALESVLPLLSDPTVPTPDYIIADVGATVVDTNLRPVEVLVLSEFAGAAVELHGALLTNPYDANAMTASLHEALTMGADERAYRTARIATITAGHDVARWGQDFIAAVDAAGPDQAMAA